MAFDWFKKEKNQAHHDGISSTPDRAKAPNNATGSGKETQFNKDGHEAADTGAEESPPTGKSPGFLKRLKSGLTRTRENLSGGLEKIFSGFVQ